MKAIKNKIMFVFLLVSVFFLSSCSSRSKNSNVSVTDYGLPENWVYYGLGDDKSTDLFFIGPTVYMGDKDNMPIEDSISKQQFIKALNAECEVYKESTKMYAPYYREAAIKAYSLTPEDREQYMQIAYSDISAAFSHYLKNKNDGRSIILAGFSQGADMCYRLLEEYFGKDNLYEQLVAVYAIGWPCTKEMVDKFPQIKPAKSENDIGTVISFDCEAPEINDTFVVPKDTSCYTINPLNWRTDSVVADKSENLGALFTDPIDQTQNEIPEFCGCYIDEDRGVLKIPDIDKSKYPAVIPGLQDGAYHIYDYQFFFRNLQKNIKTRINTFQSIKNHVNKSSEIK